VAALINHQHIYGDLGGEWWEWVFDPDNGFGMFADGPVDCGIGQEKNKVWFLAGTFSGTAERTCTIKKGKSLFIPLVNQLIFYDPTFDPAYFDLTLEQKRIFLDGRIGGGSLSDDPGVAELAIGEGLFSTVACDLHATLDGEPLVFATPIVRAQSGPATVEPDEEALADGFYALIEPLAAGMHVLEFGGALCDAAALGTRDFDTTVRYNLNVE